MVFAPEVSLLPSFTIITIIIIELALESCLLFIAQSLQW